VDGLFLFRIFFKVLDVSIMFFLCLTGLGLVGGEYSRIRQLLTKPLSGNGAWRYGLPEKEAVEETASAPQTAEESPADEALGDTPAEAEGTNVGEINADTAEDGEEVSGDEQ